MTETYISNEQAEYTQLENILGVMEQLAAIVRDRAAGIQQFTNGDHITWARNDTGLNITASQHRLDGLGPAASVACSFTLIEGQGPEDVSYILREDDPQPFKISSRAETEGRPYWKRAGYQLDTESFFGEIKPGGKEPSYTQGELSNLFTFVDSLLEDMRPKDPAGTLES